MSVECSEDYFESSDGDVRVWIEQGSAIHIKAITEHNAPVELNAEQALELAPSAATLGSAALGMKGLFVLA